MLIFKFARVWLKRFIFWSRQWQTVARFLLVFPRHFPRKIKLLSTPFALWDFVSAYFNNNEMIFKVFVSLILPLPLSRSRIPIANISLHIYIFSLSLNIGLYLYLSFHYISLSIKHLIWNIMIYIFGLCRSWYIFQ